jgi:hypothetical protein
MDRLTRLKIAARLPVSVLWGKVRDAAQRRRTDRALRVSVAERGMPHAPCTFRPLDLAPLRPDWYAPPRDHAIRAFHVAMPARLSGSDRAAALAAVSAPARRIADAAAALLGPEHAYTDWWSDPRGDARWDPAQWHRDVAARRGDDIKIPLEAGRLHSLVQWSLDPSSQQQVRTALLDFIACNPACYGVQWCSGIDVGLRALNICLALEWSGTTLSHEERDIVTHALTSHAIWLEHYIEWSGGMRTSHYLANLLGLLAVGTWLPDHPDAWRWRQRGMVGLEKEFAVQFLNDGMNFEASTAYHRHCIDIMAWATRILRLSHTLSDEWMSRLAKGLTALDAFTRPDGSLWPVIGDTDSGLAVKLTEAPRVYHDDLLHGPYSGPHSGPLYSLSDFGLHACLTPSYACWIRAGSIGQFGKGGHAHNDQLSLVLRVRDVEFLTDPGMQTYTSAPDLRNTQRSTAVHSTLVVAGREQNAFPLDDGEGLFWMTADRARAKTLVHTPSTYVGEHEGYGSPHRRELLFTEHVIQGTDRYSGGGSPAVHFHCAPCVEVTLEHHCAILERQGVRVVLAWTDADAVLHESWCSHEYTERVASRIIALRMHSDTIHWTLTLTGATTA